MSKNKPVVNIIDVNNLLYIGNHRFRKYSIRDINGFEIKTGGMYMVLNLLRKHSLNPKANTWIFCFDRNSYRSELGMQLGIDYKANRPKMPAHLRIQSDELYKWLPKIGYNAIAVDGFEADDVINSLAYMFKDLPVKVNIFSTDRDYAFNVSDNCEIVSSNSRVPSILKENYESVIAGSKGRKVYYNTVLLYKVICGDDSDKIPPITKEAYALYLAIIKKLQEIGISLDEISDFDKLEACLGLLSEDLKQKALDNWQLVKPDLTLKDIIKLTPQKINEENLYEFCSIFGMNSIAKKFGISLTDFAPTVSSYRLDLQKRIASLDSGYKEEVFKYYNDDTNNPNISDLERLKEIQEIKKKVSGTIEYNNQTEGDIKLSISANVDGVD